MRFVFDTNGMAGHSTAFMEIVSREEPTYICYSISGEIDLYNSSVLKARLFEDFDKSGKHVLLDLKNTGYVDSTGLSVIIQTSVRLKDTKKDVKIIHAAPSVLSVLSMLDMPGRLQVCASEEEARMFFR